VATVAELRAALLPDSVPVGEPLPERLAAPVAWVRVLRARVPALDVLEAGDVVVVPALALAVVAETGRERRDLVATLARARIAGVLLVPAGPIGEGGPPAPASADEALDELGAATADLRVPTFRLPRTDPGVLERTLIGFLVDRRGELERQGAVLESRLAALALMGRDLDVLAAAIAAFLRRAVAIEGRRGDALAVHAPADLPEAAAAVTAYLARPGAGALRVALPAGPGEPAPAGRLVLLGERPVAELDRVVAERIAPLLALELDRDARIRQARDEARRGDPLPAAGPPWVVLVARQATGGDADAVAAREEVRHELRLRFPPRRLTLRGTSESLELRLVAALDGDDPWGVGVASRIATFLGRPVAVSRAFTEPGQRPAAEASARTALEAAEALPAPPSIVRADRLPAYRLLGNLPNLPDARGQSRALLEPILAGRASAVDERLATLRAVLDHGGPGEAAAALGIHRNTVAYRLGRIQAATGWDLADPELRLALAVAIRIVQSAQE
jgi:purine catabolism regulator